MRLSAILNARRSVVRLMEFSYSKAQQRRQARVLAAFRDAPGSPDGAFDEAGWEACADLGLQGLVVPKRHGGQGLDALEALAALEALGYACRDRGLTFALGAHLWGCVAPLLAFGGARHKALLPALCSGRLIGAHALTEAGAGSDIRGVETRAERRGGRYLLTGRKTFVTNGPRAGVFLVYAQAVQGKTRALTCFVVRRDSPGLAVSRLPLMGLSRCPVGELALDVCPVEASDALGGVGAGEAVFQHAMEWERGAIMAPAVGAMARQLERCLEHAASRRQFGAPLLEFQLVAARLADMRLRLETSRALLYRFGWLKARGRTAAAEGAMAKLHISESWIQSCQDAMHLFGGRGYLSAAGLEEELRDALASRAYSGTSDIQRLIIARMSAAER